MKKAVLFALYFGLTGCVINPSFHKLPESEQQKLKPTSTTATMMLKDQNRTWQQPATATVHCIDNRLIQGFIDSSKAPITHIYFYTSYCKPCIAELPATLQLHQRRAEANLLMITPQSWVDIEFIKSFLQKMQVGIATYILDAEQYGDEYSDVNRYHRFVEELYPGHPQLDGFPLHLLVDKQHHVRYAAFGSHRFTESVLDSVLRAVH